MASTSPVKSDCVRAGTKRRAESSLTEDIGTIAENIMTVALRLDDGSACTRLLFGVLKLERGQRACLAEHPGFLCALAGFTEPGATPDIQALAGRVLGDVVDAWHRTRDTVLKDGSPAQGKGSNIVLGNADLVRSLLDNIARCASTWARRILDDAIRFQDKCRFSEKYTAAQVIGFTPGAMDLLLKVMEFNSVMPHGWDSHEVYHWASFLMANVTHVAFQEEDVDDRFLTRALRLLRDPSGDADGVLALFVVRKDPLSPRQVGETRALIAYREAMQALRKAGDRAKGIRRLKQILDKRLDK